MKQENIDSQWEFTAGRAPFFSPLYRTQAPMVDLPHDMTIGTAPSPDTPDGTMTGFIRGAMGTYTKRLMIPAEWEGQRVMVRFDGAFMNAEVSLNGNLVAKHPNGYTPLHADLTPYVKFGRENRLSVQVNNSAPYTERWYPGSGIYRHVDLLTGPAVHLAPWSIFVRTDGVDGSTARVAVGVTVENRTAQTVTEHVQVTLRRASHQDVAASGDIIVTIPPMDRATGTVQIAVEDAAIWDIDDPQLYSVYAETDSGDTDSTAFGIRTISVDAVNGFQLNGRTVKLKGACVHHGNGILGAASFYDSEYRKVSLLKEHGFNGIRAAHNPPSRDMLDACDRLGMLVIDEAFDVWRMSENVNDYHLYFDQWWKRDMEWFISRDRNHPSVIMWSTGNEVKERNGLSGGNALSAELAQYVRELDPTRFVTNSLAVSFNGLDDDDTTKMQMAWAEMMTSGNKITSVQNLGNSFSRATFGRFTEAFAAPLDVVGYNYLDERYEEDGAAYPNRVMCGTESYPRNIDIIWEKVERLPYVIGDFTWTGHDYIGEAGLGNVAYVSPAEAEASNPMMGPPTRYPWRLAYCGDFDLCGFERTQLHFRKIVWGSDETFMVAHNPANADKSEVLARWGTSEAYPAWSFDGFEGVVTPVDVYSAASEVELLLNGTRIGVEPAGKANRFKAQFMVPYQPGTLIAISRNDGVEVSRHEITTAGKVVGVAITLDRDSLVANGQSLCFALVELVDAEGRRVFFDDRKAIATVSGDGTLAAFGTGRPVTDEVYAAGEFTSFEGRYQAIVRAGHDAGQIELTIAVDGLDPVSVVIGAQNPE